MADDFSVRYGDLINGSYDCVDRVALNAWYPMGVNPGGLRTWWRPVNGGSEIAERHGSVRSRPGPAGPRAGTLGMTPDAAR